MSEHQRAIGIIDDFRQELRTWQRFGEMIGAPGSEEYSHGIDRLLKHLEKRLLDDMTEPESHNGNGKVPNGH